MTQATFRIATPDEHQRVEAAYATWGYRGGVGPGDVVYVAERGAALLGAVRRTLEQGVVLLRGMYVAPSEQRRGLGTGLLRAFVADLRGDACFCVPYAHLATFYEAAGFASLASPEFPPFLRARAEAYRARGLDVIVMRRPADRDNDDAE
jgi:GNAT superfamily N-acetyltransferase